MKVGQQVALEVLAQITPRLAVAARYAGTVLQSAEYDDANTVRITSDNDNVPVRVVPKRWITQVNGEAYSFAAEPVPQAHTVGGSKGAVYEVIIDPNGNHKCTCPAFAFRGGNCKHIQMFLDVDKTPK